MANTVSSARTAPTPLRSADMTYLSLSIRREDCREALHVLGRIGKLDFTDLNDEFSAFDRLYTDKISVLDVAERSLDFLRTQAEAAQKHFDSIHSVHGLDEIRTEHEVNKAVHDIKEAKKQIDTLNVYYNTNQNNRKSLIQHRWVLKKTSEFLSYASSSTNPNAERLMASYSDSTDVDLEQNPSERGALFVPEGLISGTISRSKIPTLESILWRTLRGNLHMNRSEIPERLSGDIDSEPEDKDVFVIFTSADGNSSRVKKICRALGADLYDVELTSDGQVSTAKMSQIGDELSHINNMIANTKESRNAVFDKVRQNYWDWCSSLMKEKLVYQTLNLFSADGSPEGNSIQPAHGRTILIGEAWCPSYLVEDVVSSLNEISPVEVSVTKPRKAVSTPPTYFPTNRFTEGFQTIVDAYGTATYKEINAGLPSIVTFPFLFAVMFGDLGHAVIMTLAALAMIYFEKPLSRRKLDDLFAMAFYGRYIMLMMGIFSIYTGLIYSDIFSKSIPIFNSAWQFPAPTQPGETVTAVRVDDRTYPIGLDWAWHGSDNSLLFTNSYKMKLSILLGWAHMTFSLCLLYVNAKKLNRPEDIWGNFVPGMVFFQSIVGYLVFAIVYKWCVDWVGTESVPPSLLNMLIFMFMSPSKIDAPLYSGQAFVQQVLVILALCCVPVMLLYKPLYLWRKNRNAELGYQQIHSQEHVSALDEDDEDEPQAGTSSEGHHAGGHDDEEFSLSDVFIHQINHTIEFCLNCISHTASYLRLWALSLAHQQLSVVLWNMTMASAVTKSGLSGSIAIVGLFGGWFGLTVAVLCMMEGTSAMLHSLRLQWVEAMSKHFDNGGVKFKPFSFATLLEGVE